MAERRSDGTFVATQVADRDALDISQADPLHPQVGQRGWYHHWTHDWLPARIVDGIAAEDNGGQALAYDPPPHETVHLRIELNPTEHHSANNFGYRKAVPFARSAYPVYSWQTADQSVGQWLPEAPANWRDVKGMMEQRDEIRAQERLEAMRQAASNDAQAARA